MNETAKIVTTHQLDELCVKTLRFLAVDMVEQAKSGHPGLPLGSAAMAYTLWSRFLRFNPHDPDWPDRDRFVLSAGHGCALLYALLHLTGFDLPMEELKRFRQWGSRTPGHPEYGKTPGVEVTTGPLGQGFANAVGMAIAETMLAARFNSGAYPAVNHHTYVLASDGDLMEGVTSEAASLAGHLKLGKLIVLYADNRITIEGNTSLSFSEDRLGRFAAYGWHVQRVKNGNDIRELEAAIAAARDVTDRPSFLAVRTHIGFGSPHKQDTASAHGAPLGADEVRLMKEQFDWPREPGFHLPAEALAQFRALGERGAAEQAEWESERITWALDFPEKTTEFERVIAGQLPDDWDSMLPTFAENDGPMATRVASGKALNAIASRTPELVGGAADLAPSTHSHIEGSADYEAASRDGRNLHFGVREHAMGAILNGMAVHRGLIPYGATFLVFSDYMRPPMRLAAMNRLPVIYVFTHDSIALGEDGPTHQPVEHLLALRAIPGLIVIRPADANETVAAWRVAIGHSDAPIALVLTRQDLPVLDPGRYHDIAGGVARGAYVLVDVPTGEMPDLTLVASGSEVHLALAAHEQLHAEGIRTRVVSMPSWQLWQEQPPAYRAQVLPPGQPCFAIEAGVTLGWRPYFDGVVDVLGIDQFGASAPGETVMHEYGFSVDNLCQRVRDVVSRRRV